jgi:hypothetical protein
MSSNAKLIVHAGGVRRTRDELASLTTPTGTHSWRPVSHHELVASLISGLQARGLSVVGDEYATMGRDSAKLFGVMRLAAPGLDRDDYRLALGLRAANDRTMSIQVAAGVNVFVCDNMAFKADGAVVLRKRHTARLDLSSVIPPAIDQFLAKAAGFARDIDAMKDRALSDGDAKTLIFDAFAARRPVLPLRLFPVVSRLYFDDQEQKEKFAARTLWSLNNAFTEAVKGLKAAPRHLGGLRIGRFFGRAIQSDN